jgi:hypothetical protein
LGGPDSGREEGARRGRIIYDDGDDDPEAGDDEDAFDSGEKTMAMMMMTD